MLIWNCNTRGWARGTLGFRMLVNIPQKKAPQINVARTDFIDQENWFDPIYQAYSKKIKDMYLDSLLSLNPVERLFKMGWILGYHKILIDDLFRDFPLDYWPVAFLKANGKLDVQNFGDIKNKQVNLFPCDTYEIIEKGELISVLYSYLYDNDYVDFLTKWSGESVLFEFYYPNFRQSMTIRKRTSITYSACEISSFPFRKSYHFGPIQFVKPPWDGDPPLVQYVLLPDESSRENVDINVLLERAVIDPNSLDFSDLFRLVSKAIRNYIFHDKYAYFSEPFDHHFGFGGKLVNIGHPVGKELFRFHCYTLSHPEQASRLESLIADFFEILSSSSSTNLDDANKFLQSIWSTAREIDLFKACDVDSAKLASDDFIPGTLIAEKSYEEGNYGLFGDLIK